MNVNIFDEVKARVTTGEVVRFYGYEPNRSGFICCPFHTEKTPSLKIYDKRWHCYGCGAGGTAIDFAMKLFGISALEAAKKLNDDLHLGLETDNHRITKDERDAIRRRERTNQAYKAFSEWKDGTLLMMCNALREANGAGTMTADEWDHMTDGQLLAVQWREPVEHWYETLAYGSAQAQMEIFRNRGDIEKICKRILNRM